MIRAYFAQRLRQREGLRGRIMSFLSGRREQAPVVDMFGQIERKVRQ